MNLVIINMTPEQLAAHLGHEASNAFLFFIGGGVLHAGGRAATHAIDTAFNVGKKLVTNVLITFQHQGSRLCNGLPFDAVKLKRPIKSYAQGNTVSSANKIQNIELVANKQFLVRGLSKNEARVAMDKNEVLKTLNEIADFNFDIDFMNNVFDYSIALNELEDHDQILITRENYRKPLKLFIEGKVSSERLRAWVYYMEQTMAFTTNLDLDGEDDDVLLNIRDQISATIIDGPLTVDMAKNLLNQIKDDWKPKK